MLLQVLESSRSHGRPQESVHHLGNLVIGKEHIHLREMQGSSGDGRMQAVRDQEAEFLLEVALSYLTNSTARHIGKYSIRTNVAPVAPLLTQYVLNAVSVVA